MVNYETFNRQRRLVAEIKRRKNICQGVAHANEDNEFTHLYYNGKTEAYSEMLDFLDTLEMKEVDIDKLCEFRKNIGFAYPEGAREYQKQLACYRQGIEDTIKAQKGE